MRFWTLFKQDFSRLLFRPEVMGMFVIFPICLSLLMGFLFDGLYNSTLISSYDYYGVTMILFASMMGAIIPANVFLGQQNKGANIRIFYSPATRVSIYGSKILSCFICMSLYLLLVVMVFQVTSFVNFGGENIGYVILMLLCFFLFLTLLSCAISVSLHNEQVVSIILGDSMPVLGFLSGIMFPIANLGKSFEKISDFSPLTWTIDSIFQWIYDGNSVSYWLIVLGLLILSAILLYIVHRNYRPENYI